MNKITEWNLPENEVRDKLNDILRYVDDVLDKEVDSVDGISELLHQHAKIMQQIENLMQQ